MKFKLYSSISEWNSRHAEIKTHLGLPTPETSEYAKISQINNESHPDFGKYIFPVMTNGRWGCDDQFDPSELVDHDDNWIINEQEL